MKVVISEPTYMNYQSNRDFAIQLDEKDPLRAYRDKFYMPQHKGQDCIYFTGNSLGLQPKTAEKFIDQELEDWRDLAVEGHFKAKNRPWFHYHKFSKEILGKLLGAKPHEVVSMNNLTSNLHFMMVSFYRPKKDRFRIMIEGGAFPSDQYAVESQIKFHGYNYEEALIELHPKEGEYTLRTEDIIHNIKIHGKELALVLLPGIQYFTGQWFDVKAITKAAHEEGANIGFDLAHAIGNVPLNLHEHDVDFAVWCSYKYLNSGPGGVSGIFVHEKFTNDSNLPRFAGWWGHNEDERFKMEKSFKAMPGADGWQLSNVNVLGSAAHLASLEIFAEVGMEPLRKKSLLLTGYLEFLLNTLNHDQVILLSPKDQSERGCQLSLLINSGKEIFEKLTSKGVITDWREPNLPGEGGVIRIAPVPLYNTFTNVFDFYQLLKEFLNE
ncbi:MAG: kynureninase [Bacteroidota bacterium]